MKNPNILEIIRSDNAAELLEKERLKDIGKEVCEKYAEDKESMSDWIGDLEKGMKMAEVEETTKATPFEGSCNYKSNIIDQAVIEFGDRALTEILGKDDLVTMKKNVDKPDEQLLARINRVTKYMNFQYNTEQPGYREQTQNLFYELARIGVVFRKTYYDSEKGCNKAAMIRYPNFVVNNNTANGDDLPCFTELKDYTDSEVDAKKNLGIWLDCDLVSDDTKEEDDDSDQMLDDEQEDDRKESDCKFIEQYTWLDLDGDDIYEPYIVTVHRPSQKVVRVVARFDESNIKVKTGPGVVGKFESEYTSALQSLLMERAQEIAAGGVSEEEAQEMLEDSQGLIDELSIEAIERVEIINIEPLEVITKYSFINSPKGDYLSYGFCHILCSLVSLVNTTTNQIVDAAKLQNVGGGFKSKEFRNTRSNMKIKPGELVQTDISADTLANGIKMLDFKGPSGYLVQFSDKVKQEALQTAQRVLLEESVSPNAPAATTLGILAEKMVPTTARFQSILQAMGKEFKIMFRLNGIYTDPNLYAQVCNLPAGTPENLYQMDFETQTYDIEPRATGNAMSKSVKLQRTSALLALSDGVMAAGGDMRPIYEEVFDSLEASSLFNKVFPNKDEMTPQQQQALQQQLQMQQQALQQQQIANQISQQQLEEKQTENEIKRVKLQQEQQKLDREDRKVLAELQFQAAELQRKTFETNIDAEATIAQAEKYLAEAGKVRAETESEVVKARMQEVEMMLNQVKETVEGFDR